MPKKEEVVIEKVKKEIQQELSAVPFLSEDLDHDNSHDIPCQKVLNRY